MAEARVQRRLAAILAADVVGYSRMMGEDETGTLARLQTIRKELLHPKVAEYGGRIVKTTGDGTLIEFPSAVDAVQHAVDVQAAIGSWHADTPDNQRIELRMGINVGDIIVAEDDIFGDGVNVAARLEALAEPGGVCISGTVFDQVKGKLDLPFDDLGPREVKNIAEPVRVYQWCVGKSAAVGKERPDQQPPLPDKPSIAVLPFDNLSGDPEQEYFSDGLAEDIINLLVAWRSFPVVARNSSFAFKGQSHDVRQIANELSARYVIEGSVRKSGNRVRVTAQLIDAETRHHLWADKFDGALDDIFEIQDELTRRIVASVEPEMEQAELRKAETERAANLSAWDYFLRGRAHLHLMTPDGNKHARALFENAIALDPDYSDAFAGLSLTYQRDIHFEIAEDRQAWEAEALKAARQAVALDNGSSFAHLALGGAYIWSNQHDLSIAETRTAVELNPSNVQACLALGNRLDIVGKPEEGLPLLERSLALNPRDPHAHTYFAQLARANINARNYDKALEYLHEALRRKDDHPHTYHVLAICLGHLGRIEEAREAARRCEELRPGFLKRRAHWNIYLDSEANEHLTEGLRKTGLLDDPGAQDQSPPLPDKPSIAVLPFDNLSDDSEQEYFADGISEDIITALSKFRSFFVIARNSTFTYKGQAVEVTRVGKELGVRYVLEGSVRKAGDRLRTSAQLVDAQSGNHVWAERYDGSVADIFDLQDEITTQIVGALVPEVDAAERARALRRPPEDVDTWVIFQRAMAHADRFNAEDNALATTLLKETIERDTGFVPAYAHLAVLRAQAARHGYASDQSAALDQAREYGLYAVSQDPNDAVAHLGLGIAAMFRGEGDVAIPEIETATELNPNFARAFVWLGFAYSWCRGGMPETEIQYYDTALRLSPRDPWRWYCLMLKGSALRVLGQHEEAVALCQAACRFPETGFLPLLHLTIALVHAGRTDEARDVAAELLQKRPELTITVFKRMLSTLCPITLEPVLFALREVGLPES